MTNDQFPMTTQIPNSNAQQWSLLTNPDYLQHLLHKNGIVPFRSAGQNFLVCEEPVQVILTALEDGSIRVTELGAGLGSLTQALVASGYRVRAIERDERLAHVLPTGMSKKQREKLNLIVGDLREIEWTWDSNYQLVGNIPYNLSGYIMRRLVSLDPTPEQVIIMVQREVGQRLAAQPPDMSLLGLAAQLWGTVYSLLHVPRSCFWPEPAVDSMIVLLIPHREAPPPAQREEILQVAALFFQHKRKQLGGVLKRVFHWSPEDLEQVLSEMGVAAAARPQELSVAQWQNLSLEIRNRKYGK